MIRNLTAVALGILAMALVIDGSLASKDQEPASIKTIMKKGHTAPKGETPLFKKVIDGTATAAEKKMLIAFYTDLTKDTPPRNDDQDWKDRTKALLAAAKADDGKALEKAANCMACHAEHKKKKKGN